MNYNRLDGGRFAGIPILAILLMLLTACTAIPQDGTGSGTTVPNATAETEAETQAETKAERLADNQRAVLAMQLGIPFDDVQMIAHEAVTWPDACLGKPDPVELCAPAQTPGYRITLAANGATYVYHTNEDGTNVRLAEAPHQQSANAVIEWAATDDSGCRMAIFAQERILFGRCQSTLMSVPVLYAARQAELAEFAQAFAPFAADTAAGHVQFHGRGTVEAAPSQQRMLAEWARLVEQEARTGSSGAHGGLLLAWHRASESLTQCDDVTVDRAGKVHVNSCTEELAAEEPAGEEPVTVEPFRLHAEQLATVYGWMDTYQSVNFERVDSAETDAITATLLFAGTGSQAATEPEHALMMDFAQSLFLEATMAARAVPDPCLKPGDDQQILIQEAPGYCALYPAEYSLWQQYPNTVEIVQDTVLNHMEPRAFIGVEDAAGRTLDAVATQTIADYAPPGITVTPISITVDGVDAVLLDEVPGQDLTRRVLLVHNDRLYTFFFAPIGDAGTDMRDTAELLYGTLIDSFRLLERP